MPAGRLLAALGLVAFLLPAALLVPWVAPAAVVTDLALALAFAIDLRRAGGTPLEARRRWPTLLVQGTQAPVRVEVASGARWPVTVRLREGLHPGLAGEARRIRRRIPAGGTLRWTVDLVPRRRGEHRVGALTARVRGPWGLAWSQRELLPPEPRRVFPQVRWEGRVGKLLALAQRRRLGQSPTRQQGQGSELYALRDYRPGDPLTRIHWKATARFGRPVAREDTWERGGRLVVLLDCARAMASMDGGRSKLDHALAATLALSRVAVARGDVVTVLAVSDRVERSVRVRSGGRELAAAYGALFDLEARLAEPAYDLAAEATYGVESRSATVVLLTSVVDPAAAELLRSALLRLERRHRPLLVNLEDPELHDLARHAPETPAEAFAQVAALEVLLGNRRLGRRLRRAGVRFVSTPADRLALETLAAYLARFRGPAGRSGSGRSLAALVGASGP
ncbi:MAG: DUF58 domain-containing protein [Thermoanaerobaculia bacterium]